MSLAPRKIDASVITKLCTRVPEFGSRRTLGIVDSRFLKPLIQADQGKDKELTSALGQLTTALNARLAETGLPQNNPHQADIWLRFAPAIVPSATEDKEIGKFVGEGVFGAVEIGGRPSQQSVIGAVRTPTGFMLALADGVGGGPNGAEASAAGVGPLLALANNHRPLPAGFAAADQAVKLTGGNTTLAAGKIDTQTGQWSAGAAGDSRIYLIRKDGSIFLLNQPENGIFLKMSEFISNVIIFNSVYNDLKGPERKAVREQLSLISFGHPPYDKTQIDLIDDLLSRIAARREDPSLPKAKKDIFETYSSMYGLPDHKPVEELKLDGAELKPGDVFLMADDGLTLSAGEIQNIFRQGLPLKETINKLVEAGKIKNGSESDNIAIVGYLHSEPAKILTALPEAPVAKSEGPIVDFGEADIEDISDLAFLGSRDATPEMRSKHLLDILKGSTGDQQTRLDVIEAISNRGILLRDLPRTVIEEAIPLIQGDTKVQKQAVQNLQALLSPRSPLPPPLPASPASPEEAARALENYRVRYFETKDELDAARRRIGELEEQIANIVKNPLQNLAFILNQAQSAELDELYNLQQLVIDITKANSANSAVASLALYTSVKIGHLIAQKENEEEK